MQKAALDNLPCMITTSTASEESSVGWSSVDRYSEFQKYHTGMLGSWLSRTVGDAIDSLPFLSNSNTSLPKQPKPGVF